MLHLYKPEWLRELRQRAILSQRDVERLTGISDSTVAYLESGKRKPQTKTLRKLLNIYGINISRWEHMERTWDAGKENIGELPLAQSAGPRRAGGQGQSPERSEPNRRSTYRSSRTLIIH